jgi:hypothetical protein
MQAFRRPAIGIAALVAALSLHADPARGQTGAGRQNLMEPRAGFERLNVFEGRWRDPAAPGSEEHCAWQVGARRHLICRRRMETPTGTREQTTIYSYRNRDSTYVVNVLIASGQLFTYAGRIDGDRWVLDFQGTAGAGQRLRMVVTPGPNAIRFVEESSENSGPWQVTEDFTHVRVTGP